MMKSLVNRFKKFRRPKKPRNPQPSFGKSVGTKKPGMVKRPMPPPSEDSVSFERHTKVLQAEFKKKNRNTAVVNDLMDISFAIRCSEILEKGYDLPSLFTRFPFLQESEQVCIFNKCVINLWSICGY